VEVEGVIHMGLLVVEEYKILAVVVVDVEMKDLHQK